MTFIKSSFAVIFLWFMIAFNSQQAESQITPHDCINDKHVYITQRTYTVCTGRHHRCTKSTIKNRHPDKEILVTVEYIDINCNGENNLIFLAPDLNIDYCLDYAFDPFFDGDFSFISDYPSVSIIRKGKINLKFTLELVPRITPPPINGTFENATFTNYPDTFANATFENMQTTQSTNMTSAPRTCGRAAIEPTFRENLRIVNGITVNPNSWPWQVYMSDGNYQCGAALIETDSRQWVVTAAHCEFDINTLYVYLGVHNIQEEEGLKIKVEKFIPHESYPPNNYDFDIALLKLETPVQYTEKISPICMPGGRVTKIGDNATVTGWGATSEGGATSDILLQVDITVKNMTYCGSDPETGICAGQEDPILDSCQGDSGGPFAVKDEQGFYYLAGVVSHGVGCRGNGVYTRVEVYESWIASQIANNP